MGCALLALLALVAGTQACGSESAPREPEAGGDAGKPFDDGSVNTADASDDGGAPPVDAANAADAADASDGSDGAVVDPPVVHPIDGVTVETFAGSATSGSAEGTGAAAQFENPAGVAIKDGSIVLVVEYDGGRVRAINSSGATSLVASGLPQPFGIAVAPDALFVQTDRDQNGAKGPTSGTIWRVPTAGAPEVVVTGLGRPRGLARLSDGRIVLSDRLRHTISLLEPTNASVTLLAGSAAPGFADGSGAAAQFNGPYGAAVLPDGSIVVADSSNHCIRRVTLAGEVTVFAGDRTRGMRDDPDKANARFDSPKDVATDANGNVYVAEEGNHRIRRISAAGVETVAGDGTLGFADGLGTSAKFFGQEQLDVSADGKTIYVSDGDGGEGEPYHRIRRITLP